MDPHIPRMSPHEARAWVALVSLAELLPNALDAQLTADAGLINFEYGILSVLTLAPDRTLRMGELAVAVNSPAPKLSKAVTRLEKKGLVERVPCPSDGRAINVHLTRAGRRAWLTVTPPHIAFARGTLLADLDDSQLAALADLVEPILGRLDPSGALGRVPARARGGATRSAPDQASTEARDAGRGISERP